jgi:hypothetical protein
LACSFTVSGLLKSGLCSIKSSRCNLCFSFLGAPKRARSRIMSGCYSQVAASARHHLVGSCERVACHVFWRVQSNPQMSQKLSRWKFFQWTLNFRDGGACICPCACKAAERPLLKHPQLAGFFTSPHSSPPHATLCSPSDLGHRRRSIRFLRSVRLVLTARERVTVCCAETAPRMRF